MSALQAASHRAGKLCIPWQRCSSQQWYPGPSMMMCHTAFLFFKSGISILQLKHTVRCVSWIIKEWLEAGWISSAWERQHWRIWEVYKILLYTAMGRWELPVLSVYSSARASGQQVNLFRPMMKTKEKIDGGKGEGNSLKFFRSTLTFLLRIHLTFIIEAFYFPSSIPCSSSLLHLPT